jgi:hypothetical protein
LASPATARASRVLPVPGGPISKHAFGDLGADALELLRVFQKLDDFFKVLLGLQVAGHIFKGYRSFSLPYSRARLLPKLSAWLPCPWALLNINIKMAAIIITGRAG